MRCLPFDSSPFGEFAQGRLGSARLDNRIAGQKMQYDQAMLERLWAPWRMTYIEQKDAPDCCIFDELPQQQNDRENLILYRGQMAFVILNAFPYTNGHLMIAPYKHTASLAELSDMELLEINQLLASAVGWIQESYQPDGFNIGINLGRAAGAGIPGHIHWHIVPRWSGDTNFMSTVGEVRVLPQSLFDSYDRLQKVISKT